MRIAMPTASIVLLAAFSLAGCATVRPVDTRDESSIRPSLEEGDRVAATTKDHQRFELRVVSLSGTAMTGEGSDGQSITIPFEELLRLQIREPRPGRTAAAVAGGIVGTAVVLYAAAIAAGVLVVGAVMGGC